MRNESEGNTGAGAGPSKEEVFFASDGVTVTSARFIVPGQTYAMSGITSVKHWRTPRKWLLGALLLLIGLPMLLSGIGIATSPGGSNGPLVIGLLFAVGGAWAIYRGRPQFQVRLQSASGESTAFASQDDSLVRRIVAALTEAIIFRG